MANYPSYIAHGTAGGENEYGLYVEISINSMGATDAELADALKAAINSITGHSDATVVRHDITQASL